MKKQFPCYKRKPSAFFDDTIGWDADLKGVYSLLLDLIYMHDGLLADDSGYIVGMLGISSKRKWTGYKKQLVDKRKITIENGYLRNHRTSIESELEAPQ